MLVDGEEKPIAFRLLAPLSSEQNYAYIGKEALGIIFGIKNFHQILLGRNFTLVTDHKPLLHLLGPKSAIPTMAAARLQLWTVLVSQYDYTIEYQCSKDNAVAGGSEDLEVGTESEIFVTEVVDSSFPVTAAEIAEDTKEDTLPKQRYKKTLFCRSEAMVMSDELS